MTSMQISLDLGIFKNWGSFFVGRNERHCCHLEPSEDSESWFSQGFYMIPRQHTQSPFGCGAGMLLQMIRNGETLSFQAMKIEFLRHL